MSNKIECPNCHTAFTIDEAGYADIVRQVHGAEFEKALDERLQAAERREAGRNRAGRFPRPKLMEPWERSGERKTKLRSCRQS